jgi:hypothetical protein
MWTLLDLAGSVALLLWGLHMVQTGIQRGFGTDLRRWLGTTLGNRPSATPLVQHLPNAEKAGKSRPSRFSAASAASVATAATCLAEWEQPDARALRMGAIDVGGLPVLGRRYPRGVLSRDTRVDGARNDVARVSLAAGRAFTVTRKSRTDAESVCCGSGSGKNNGLHGLSPQRALC